MLPPSADSPTPSSLTKYRSHEGTDNVGLVNFAA